MITHGLVCMRYRVLTYMSITRDFSSDEEELKSHHVIIITFECAFNELMLTMPIRYYMRTNTQWGS